MADRQRAIPTLDCSSQNPVAPLHKQSLSPGARQLVELMQHIGYGSVEELSIVRGEPNFDRLPRVTREIKFGERETTQASMSTDAAPKRHVIELFAALVGIGDGVIERLEVRHGLPFRMIIAEPFAEKEG
jgi:hypothetical protein